MLRRGATVGVLLALALVSGRAFGRSLLLERFDVELTVSQKGDLEVTETLVPRFHGEWNGIYRRIPVEYKTPQGLSYALRLEDLGASDENGRSLKLERSRDRHYLAMRIWVPGAKDATKTVVLRYRVPAGRALRFFPDHDELYWNLTGDEWEISILSARALIRLPDVEAARAVAFSGQFGSTRQDAEVLVEGSEVRVRMLRPLAFREGVTVAVGWNPGRVARPTPAQRALATARDNWPLFLPIGVFLLLLWRWWRVGRDPNRRAIAVAYAPAEGHTPAELGTLIDHKPDLRDILASIVYLAVGGYLRIEEQEKEWVFGLFSSREYVFHRLKKPPGDDLGGHERLLLDKLFAGGDTTSTSDLEQVFYRHLPALRERLLDRMVWRGYYTTRPDRAPIPYRVMALVVAVFSITLLHVITDKLAQPYLPWAIAGGLSAVLLFVFSFFMPSRTVKGARALESALGFEEFLARVESDRFARIEKTPTMFEKYLPYAMAFGVERAWARAFSSICTAPPTWYQGGHLARFNASAFSQQLGGMSQKLGSAMTSAPRGSSGSGFGGGGSSGGGFGGGGGGGF